jgi:tetratricopeptide (TPR) repeat protein
MRKYGFFISFAIATLLIMKLMTLPVSAEETETASDRAKAAIAGGRAHEAIEILTAQISREPLADLYYQRGVSYASNNMLDAAIRDFDKAISMDGTQAAYFFRRGVVRYRQGDFQNAVDDLGVAMEFDSTNVNAAAYRARALFMLHRPTKALDDVLTALENNPDSPVLHKLKADFLSASGNFSDAARDYGRAIELGARDATIFNNRGVALANIGKVREAMEDIVRAMEFAESKPPAGKNTPFGETPW